MRLTTQYLDEADQLAGRIAIIDRERVIAGDPTGKGRQLLPVRVEECTPSGLVRAIVHVGLVGIEEPEARRRLLAGVAQPRPRPGLGAVPRTARRPVPRGLAPDLAGAGPQPERRRP